MLCSGSEERSETKSQSLFHKGPQHYALLCRIYRPLCDALRTSYAILSFSVLMYVLCFLVIFHLLDSTWLCSQPNLTRSPNTPKCRVSLHHCTFRLTFPTSPVRWGWHAEFDRPMKSGGQFHESQRSIHVLRSKQLSTLM
jgi:hypothetical protein